MAASMRFGLIVLVITILCFLSKTQSSKESSIVDIPDFQHNATVLKLANYALTDWNFAHNAGLVFQKVVGAQVQAKTGKEAIYYILIQVLDASSFVVVYSAQILYEQGMGDPWVQTFTPLLPPTPL
ncbi:hypothetical protein SUGI_1001520 [Cryptomeria japonica]|uniref:uncharacterized protein LOC131030886 n=1 Tax=Cryptomeria japonica TaxID=3369 RepID=UPI002414CF72|nr:uncharacterized protein LOC131030886 [Cryptomeria japonica]GLJ47453.1 hypothetical protein SUGI_1001520 [Cryptomeria japonica]